MERAIDVMRAVGAVIVDPVSLGQRPVKPLLTHVRLSIAETHVLLYEFHAGLDAYLANRGPNVEVRSLDDLIFFNERHADEEMAFFGQERLLAARTTGPLSDSTYLSARTAARRLSREDGLDRTMTEHTLDAIVAPTGGAGLGHRSGQR